MNILFKPSLKPLRLKLGIGLALGLMTTTCLGSEFYPDSEDGYIAREIATNHITSQDQSLRGKILQYQAECAPQFGLVTDASTATGSIRIITSLEETEPTLGEKLKKNTFVELGQGIFICLQPTPSENQPRLPSPFFAILRTKLPPQTYTISGITPTTEDYLAWALAGYDFQFSKSTWSQIPEMASLILPENVNKLEIETLANVTILFRNGMRMRTNQYTPEIAASFMNDLAGKYGASVETISDEMLKANFLSVYEVGKGSKDKPNVTILKWSHPNPLLTLDLVGKGVCFDTGGNNLKTDPSLMYMDKGGALAQNALAELIMAMNLPIKLRLGNAWVVNSPGGEATNTFDIYKIGDLTVENKNTDAEGRLIMAPVLAYFAKNSPAEITQTQATLTGAALSGYGVNTAVVYAPKKVAKPLMKSMRKVGDPAWQGPRDTRYLKELRNSDADLANMGGGYGGSSIADQFLCQFASKATNYIHIDSACAIKGSSGITPSVTAGDMFGVRGTFEYLKREIDRRAID